jgi:hypothetical protein
MKLPLLSVVVPMVVPLRYTFADEALPSECDTVPLIVAF